jgi:hypothetical protein
MLACGRTCNPTRVLREIESFVSSTRVALVETDAGLGYVKGMRNPEGPKALVSELVAAELAVWFGLSIPPFAVIEKCEIEIKMKDWPHRMKAPLFFSKRVDGFPRDGSATIISKLRRPRDIAKLVVFDTWVRNADRYSLGIANSDNLLFVRRGNQRNYDLTPIDHTHCFFEDMLGANMIDAIVRDGVVYGDFPEFTPYLTRTAVGGALDSLSKLDRDFVDEIVAATPQEWGLGASAAKRLADFICRRAAFVVETMAEKIVKTPESSGIGT